MCKVCISNINKPHLISPAFAKRLKAHSQRIQKAVKEGSYDSILVDIDLTHDIAQNLASDALNAYGFNFDEVEWMGDDFKALTAIEHNLYRFSTFKNANYIAELKAIKHLSDKEYHQAANKISKNYNTNYLRAETQYANRVAAQHRRWNDIQRMSHEFMYLQYKTREDGRVRYKHTLYNNFTALASDPVWRYLYPPLKNDYGCTQVVNYLIFLFKSKV